MIMLCPLVHSGSRLGCIYHHDVRVVQHHIGMIQHSKQSVCSLQWSPDSKMLASGSSDGLLNIWPNDPGVPMGCRPLISVPHASAVKVGWKNGHFNWDNWTYIMCLAS